MTTNMKYPLPRLVALFVLLIGAVPASAENKTTALFNGENLSNWTIVNDGQFSVEDGLLKVNRGTGWLRSNQTFRDFTLVLEVRFGEARANSGIFVRTGPTSNDDENGWPNNGYQVQCMDALDVEHPFATMIEYGASSFEQLYDLSKLEAAKKPTGEWNHLEITCRGENLAARLNGEVVTLAQGVAKLSGHVGIQGENGLLEFRKIEITEL